MRSLLARLPRDRRGANVCERDLPAPPCKHPSAGSPVQRQPQFSGPGRTIAVAATLLWAGIATTFAEPTEISGRYPHLTMFSESPEVGQGAAVYWKDRLWVITYAPHMPRGSGDKLYIIDDDLNMEVYSGSIGGTPANRMIHRESNQLLIGPYVIDADRNIRVIPTGNRPQDAKENKMFGRLTATARHLHDPENKVYYFDMEGVLYEVDVNMLEVDLLYVRPIPGWHGKGGYTGQGRLVLANNGELGAADPDAYGAFEYQVDVAQNSSEDAGVLADWDGASEWRLLQRRQFTEVTGPGGIYGAFSEEDPVWATGWDKRSLILMVMQDGEWHEFRMPKADYSYDGTHGWHTEWPRIREAVPASDGKEARLLMNKHGGLYDFPKYLSADNTSGLRPIGSYLKIISDTQPWHNDRIVFACNETSTFNNPAAGQAQSNLWFSSWEGIHELGQPVGWGGVWMQDDVAEEEWSVPYLIAGYEDRVLHLAHENDDPVTFSLEIDSNGRGDWEPYRQIEVSARGYDFHVFDDELDSQWIRLSPNRESIKTTAYFHFGLSQGVVEDSELFAPLASVEESSPYVRGIIRPRGDDLGTLHMLATRVEENGGTTEVGHYEIGADLVLHERNDDVSAAEYIARVAEIDETGTGIAPDQDVTVSFDNASVIVTQGERRYRLPKSHEAYDEFPLARGVREVVTERAILNAHGTFYMLPRNNSGGVRAIKPISTHNKQISDWASWRGMLALMGTTADFDSSHSNFVSSEDGKAGLWLGDIDDLWKLGSPRGTGGPWKNTAVEAGKASDPYLMTGYDKKCLTLSHESDEAVTFSLKVDVFGAINTNEIYFPYKDVTVPPGETIEYVFPSGFAAHWIQLTSDSDTTATATFVYE